jgi:predicted MFS family arabinose efflux permease
MTHPHDRTNDIGLAGLAAALAAQGADRLHDRGWSAPATGAGLLLAVISLLIADAGQHSIILVLIAVMMLDVAIQAVNILNQTRLCAVDPTVRSRISTAFVGTNFIGAAIDSTLTGILWQLDGWSAVTLVGALLAFALVVWLAQRSALGPGMRPIDELAPERI